LLDEEFPNVKDDSYNDYTIPVTFLR
jgi:hypothetical protein